MLLQEIKQLLHKNAYPGRGILVGKNGDGDTVIVYFIMGRSENSRNRVFEATDDGIRTRAFDEKKCSDPSLIIYAPVRRVGGATVVTNGDQTDTVRDALSIGCEGDDARFSAFVSGLCRREFEPDAPNFTPRISAIAYESGYAMSILKSEDQSGKACQRNFYRYEYERGVCHLIHTYEHDGDPIPTFRGEPKRALTPTGTAEQIAREVWSSLDEGNRVSLYALRLHGAEREQFMINKHEL